MDTDFKTWVDVATETQPTREKEFVDEEINKKMKDIMSAYRATTLTEETDIIDDDNFNESALKHACSKYMFNYDRAKDWIFNREK